MTTSGCILFYGTCGAGIGTGFFLSIVLNSTPLSNNEWKLCHLITSHSLHIIALRWSAMQCKRDTYLALASAMDFIKANLHIELSKSPVVCRFFTQNKKCKQNNCIYFPK